MSNDFNLDNEGSGFNLDDDSDIDAMMNQASQGEDDRENGSEISGPGTPGGHALNLDDLQDHGDSEQDQHISTPAMEVTRDHVEEQHQVIAPEPEQHVVPVEEEHDPMASFGATMLPPEEPEPEATVEPEPAPEPIFVAPEPEPAPMPEQQPESTPVQPTVESREEVPMEATSRPRNQIHVPSGADELKRIHLIVGILDACRSLNSTDREIVGKFLAQDDEANLSEDELVYSVLTSSPSVRTGIRQIKEAKALVDVERAFYVIELRDTDLYNMGQLISIFSEEEPDRNASRTQYARQLVRCVDQLDATLMQYVEAIQSVLAVLEDTE